MDHQQQQITKVCLNCPRCYSTNTKFCYYNNYSLSQPRHFCKACKRYWTKGGSLRNVPVGGGSRKNSKRVKNNIVLLPSSTSTLSSILVDPPLSSSNQVSRIPTSTIPADIQGASNDVSTPSLFGTYKDVMIQHQLQLCNIHSEMNYAANNNNDPTDTLFFSGFNNTIVEYDALQNVAPLSSIFQQANTNIQQLLERVFPFQTMQRQQQKQQPSSNTTTGHHNLGGQQQQEQTWNTNHDPHSSSMMHTWGSGYRRNVTLWPPNQLADMDG